MKKEYWQVQEPGRSIVWEMTEAHKDQLEQSGERVSLITTYGRTTQGGLLLSYHPVFPGLRKRPNDTHASFQCDIDENELPRLFADGQPLHETPCKAVLDGVLTVFTKTARGLSLTRRIFPSETLSAALILCTVKNEGKTDVTLTTDRPADFACYARTLGCMGICRIEAGCDLKDPFLLAAGAEKTVTYTLRGRYPSEACPPPDGEKEYADRMARMTALREMVKLETDDPVLDTAFAFARQRAGESIFKTRSGYLHSPGGWDYYAAIWCNDEVEYAGPYFAYTKDEKLLAAAENAYALYLPFMDEALEAIPSSIIAEGVDYWNGAGDRGDAAMYLYGVCRFLLLAGDRAAADRFWPAVCFCAAYCLKKRNADGVIASDSDELEGRFPSGDANLSTSCLALEGFRLAALLAEARHEPEKAACWKRAHDELKENIVRFFGATVQGYETFRYYKGNDKLRAWICLPLCVGINDRLDGTEAALMSSALKTEDGIRSEAGCDTIWDRATLYALRGLFTAGRSAQAGAFLNTYIRSRLLGFHVPVPVEAVGYEGNQRQLSGESALFCQILTDGICSIRPEGVGRFSLAPVLPETLHRLSLTNFCLGGQVLTLKADDTGYTLTDAKGTVLAAAAQGVRSSFQL